MLEDRLSNLTEKYFSNAIETGNGLIIETIKDCKDYHNELLINTDIANNETEKHIIINENHIIKELQVKHPKTIISSCKSLEKFVWNESIIDEFNSDLNNDYGIIYSSHKNG